MISLPKTLYIYSPYIYVYMVLVNPSFVLFFWRILYLNMSCVLQHSSSSSVKLLVCVCVCVFVSPESFVPLAEAVLLRVAKGCVAKGCGKSIRPEHIDNLGLVRTVHYRKIRKNSETTVYMYDVQIYMCMEL